MNLLFAPFTKVEETPDGLIVEGIASSERVDTANEVVDYDSLKAQLPDYTQWNNVRAMHQPIAAGKALVVTPDDESRSLFLRALIVDDDSIKKVRTEVYKGFSIGGKGEGKVIKRADGSTYTRQYVQLLSEISIVDRPANPDARFTLIKREDAAMADDKDKEETPPAPQLSAEQITTLQKLAGTLKPAAIAKAASDPQKIIALIQQARNDAEIAGDLDGAALYTQSIALILQATGDADESEAESAAEGDLGPAAQEQATTPQMAAAAASGNLQKAGRVFNTKNLIAMENTVKTLLQMMAGAGSSKAQKAIAAMADGDEMSMSAKAIGGELEKVLTPLAAGVLNINDRLTAIEKQPMPGGPIVRPGVVTKVIAGQTPAQETKPAMPGIIKAQLDDLQRKARTDPNPAFRTLYQSQVDDIRKDYQ